MNTIMYDVIISIDSECRKEDFLSYTVSTLINIIPSCNDHLAVKMVTEAYQKGSSLVYNSPDLSSVVKIRDLLLSHGIISEIRIVDCSVTKK